MPCKFSCEPFFISTVTLRNPRTIKENLIIFLYYVERIQWWLIVLYHSKSTTKRDYMNVVCRFNKGYCEEINQGNIFFFFESLAQPKEGSKPLP